MKDIVFRIRESRWTMILLPILLLAVIVIVFTALTGAAFIQVKNINVIIQQAMIVGTVATGACFIFATGNVNIAMGSCTALVATVSCMFYNKTGSIAGMFIVAVLFGIFVMVICALLSTKLNVMVIHVTIVMMTMLRAIQSELVGGVGVTLPFSMTNAVNSVGLPYYIFFGFVIICCILFHFTRVGRHIKMVGANEKSAELTGLQRDTALLIAFIMAGIGAGLAGLLTAYRTGSITQLTSDGLNMDVVLAVVLGGMSVYGGSKSKIYAPLIGAITVSALNNGLLMIGVSSAFVQGVRGILFLMLLFASNKRAVLLPAREG